MVETHPSQTCTVISDRLRRKTEKGPSRRRLPSTISTYDAKRQETDPVYGSRIFNVRKQMWQRVNTSSMNSKYFFNLFYFR
jgi:hypothetical protein